MMNDVAAEVEATVKVALLGLGNVAAVAGHVPIKAGLLPTEFGVVPRGLTRVDLTIGDALVDAARLAIDPPLNFVHARMTRISRRGPPGDRSAAQLRSREDDQDQAAQLARKQN